MGIKQEIFQKDVENKNAIKLVLLQKAQPKGPSLRKKASCILNSGQAGHFANEKKHLVLKNTSFKFAGKAICLCTFTKTLFIFSSQIKLRYLT